MVVFWSNNFALADITDAEVAKAISQAKGLGGGFDIGNAYNKLLPKEEDRKFIRQNKDKCNLTEDDILDVSRSRFDREVAKGKIEDLNKVPAEHLNEKSTLLSVRNDEASKDRSGTTPKEYMDIAVRSDENARKYQKDLEEKPFLDSVAIMENPKKNLKENHGIDIDCQEEASDPQKDLEPEIETYQVTTKKIETIEEQKSCEESEPVVLQCERNLNLSCVEAKDFEKDANELDFTQDLYDLVMKEGFDICAGGGAVRFLISQVRFLAKKGVCFNKMSPKLVKGWAMVGARHNSNRCSLTGKVMVRRWLPKNLHEIAEENCMNKRCFKWKEEWENKCEEELKGQ